MSQSEFDIIRRYFVDSGLSWSRPGIVLGIGDDAAILEVPEQRQLCLSMDVLVAGVHFPETVKPADIAYRSLAVNLSDLAAMAAQPFCFSLGLSLPRADENWLGEFSAGLLELARQFDCPLVGGDLTTGPLSIAIQVHGLDSGQGLLRRDGAKPGDRIYVSGTLGDAAIALASMQLPTHLDSSFQVKLENQTAACKDYFRTRYYRPQPRVALAQACASFASSAIDISDGLMGDLGHITRASEVGAKLWMDSLPYSSAAECCASLENRQQAALFGGDDYELCLTVAADDCERVEAAAVDANVRISCIGELVAGSGIDVEDGAGNIVKFGQTAYEHFSN